MKDAKDAPEFVRFLHDSFHQSRYQREHPIFREMIDAGHPDATSYLRLRQFFDGLPWAAGLDRRYLLAADESTWLTMESPRLFVNHVPGPSSPWSSISQAARLCDPAREYIALAAMRGWPADVPVGVGCGWSIRFADSEARHVNRIFDCWKETASSAGPGWQGISVSLPFDESLALVRWAQRWKQGDLLVTDAILEAFTGEPVPLQAPTLPALPEMRNWRDAWL